MNHEHKPELNTYGEDCEYCGDIWPCLTVELTRAIEQIKDRMSLIEASGPDIPLAWRAAAETVIASVNALYITTEIEDEA